MKFFEQLLELVTSFTLKRAFSLVVILGIVLGTALSIDYYTGYTRLYRLERSIALTERVYALQQHGNPSKTVSAVTDSISAELADILAKDQIPNYRASALTAWLSERWLKMICGGLPWFLISLLGLPSDRKKEKNAWFGFLAAQSLTIAFAVVNLAIPPFQKWWLDLVLVPIGVSLVVGVIPLSIIAATAYRKVQESTRERAIRNQLCMLAAAMNQFRMENGRDPHDLSGIVGPNKYLKPLISVDREQYDTLDLRMGKMLTVFRKSGESVSYG